jgi:CBS-domain-containing membrane protein
MNIREYFLKMKGGAKSPPGVGLSEMFWSWLGAVIGIGFCGYLSSKYFEPRDFTLIIGSFGASAVLVYGAIKSPLAQPRNLIGGHIISGLIGVACYKLFGEVIWLASALAVSLAIVAMLASKTLHPPGGATALIAVIGGKKIHDLGFLYAFIPAGLGSIILLIVALLINNLSKNRRYPEYWV